MTNVKRFGEKKQEMEEIEDFKKKIMKGLTDVLFLQIVNQKPQYGYGIRQEIELSHGVKLARVTCYIKMYKLEKLGYLKSEITDTLSHPMRIRRYYTITDKGKKILNAMMDFLDQFEFFRIEKEPANLRDLVKKKNRIIHPTS